MSEKILSIIIPVYNVDRYLERCVESIIIQEISECEVILVNDGSTDKSGELCNKYANENDNISCYHRENGGLSEARNTGLEKAKGRYIWFVDSDDYITSNAISEVIEALKRNPCDVFVCTSKTIDEFNQENDEREYSIKTGMYSSYEYMEMLKKNPRSVLFCAQYHICKKALLERYEMKFKKGIIHEDELWTPQLLIYAEKIYYSNCKVYYHYMREGSIMHSSKMEKSGFSDLIVTQNLLKIFNESGRKDLVYMRDHMVDTFLQAVWKIPGFFEKEYDIMRTMPLKNAYYFKTRIKAFLYFLSPKVYLYVHKKVKK